MAVNREDGTKKENNGREKSHNGKMANRLLHNDWQPMQKYPQKGGLKAEARGGGGKKQRGRGPSLFS